MLQKPGSAPAGWATWVCSVTLSFYCGKEDDSDTIFGLQHDTITFGLKVILKVILTSWLKQKAQLFCITWLDKILVGQVHRTFSHSSSYHKGSSYLSETNKYIMTPSVRSP